MCIRLHSNQWSSFRLLMIILQTIITNIPPGTRDLVEFGFFLCVGVTAGSLGLLS